MSNGIWFTSEFSVRTCGECGTVFALLVEYVEQLRENHKTFYCPNGHARHFPQITMEEKLKEKVEHCQSEIEIWKEHSDFVEGERDMLVRSRAAYKGMITKLSRPENGHDREKDSA